WADLNSRVGSGVLVPTRVGEVLVCTIVPAKVGAATLRVITSAGSGTAIPISPHSDPLRFVLSLSYFPPAVKLPRSQAELLDAHGNVLAHKELELTARDSNATTRGYYLLECPAK